MKLLIYFLVGTIFVSGLFAQNKEPKSPFVSASVGFYRIDVSNFSKIYNSNSGFTPSLTLGLPVFSDLFMFGKVTYFYKEGIPIVNHYSWNNGSFTEYQTQDGKVTFKEFIIDGGFF